MTDDDVKFAAILDAMEKSNNENMSNTFLLMTKMLQAEQDSDKKANNSSLRNLLLLTMIMNGLDNKKDEEKLQEGFTIAQVLDMAFIQIKEINKKLETLSENVADIQSKINKMIA